MSMAVACPRSSFTKSRLRSRIEAIACPADASSWTMPQTKRSIDAVSGGAPCEGKATFHHGHAKPANLGRLHFARAFDCLCCEPARPAHLHALRDVERDRDIRFLHAFGGERGERPIGAAGSRILDDHAMIG